ncbi:MAG: hypothetical protein ACI4J5_09780 [Oscillospiraceae bacterium]
MTDTEFLSRLPEGTRKPTDKEFEDITFVYDYHPCIDPVKGKDQIAMLYSTFGMRIIYDMYETATAVCVIESERRECREKLRKLDSEYEKLAYRK